MELGKTIMMSAFVWVAGILAEIIFHEALSKSIFGIVLSIIIAVIIVTATYFVLDGIRYVLKGMGDTALNQQSVRQEQMFKALDKKLEEQIKLGQSVYDKLDDIVTINRGYMEKAAESMFDNSREEEPQVQDLAQLTSAVEEINANTLKSAKIIVKYQMKNSNELKETLDLILDELSGIQSTPASKKDSASG